MNENGSLALVYTTRNLLDLAGDGRRTLLRLICDESDPLCRRCPGGETDDSDGDGRPDACDPCTESPVPAVAVSSRTSIANADGPGAYPRRDNTFRTRTTIVLPAGSGGLAGLPVLARGLRLRTEAPGLGATLDVQLPGGTYAGRGTRGWTAKSKSLVYRDRTNALLRGVRKVVLRGVASLGDEAVLVKVQAAADQYGVDPETAPLTMTIGFGDAADAAVGLCAEFRFEPGECTSAYWAQNSGRIRCGPSSR